jgi:putative DNA primase/helicase
MMKQVRKRSRDGWLLSHVVETEAHMPSITSIDLNAMHVALARRAAEVATAILGSPNLVLSSARELRFGKRGSISVVIAGRKAGCWFDHENGVGGDLLDLIARVRGDFHRGIIFAEEIIGPVPRQLALKSHQTSYVTPRDKENNRRTDRAFMLWSEAVPIGGTISEIYLSSRGIRKLPEGVDNSVLRFHPQCPFGEKTHYPCLIALMREIHSNEPRAIQRTALTAVGEKIGRLTLGPKVGTAIKLSPDEMITQGLAVGEGLETALSAMQLGFSPAWALGDANNVRRFPVLSGIECLTLIVDNDESGTGQRVALECSRRWTEAAREVFRIIPNRCGYDMNDVIRRSPREHG